VSLRNQITNFLQKDDETLYEAYEHFKDLLYLCPHHGLQRWMIIQAFYKSVTQSVRSTIDAVAGGTLMSKTEDEAYNLIEETALNNFQWSIERIQPKLVGGKLEINTLTLLSAKVDAMSHRLDQMNVSAVNSSAPSACETYGSIEHITLNYQVRSPFSQDSNEVKYIQDFNPIPTNDPYCNAYNLGWKNNLKFSYRPNPNTVNMLPMNARVPPGFQRPLFPS